MSYKSNYTGEQIDKVIGDNLDVNIKDLKRELDDAKEIVVYQMPSDWSETGKQYQITQDNFHDIFGSEDELLKNLENKHVRLKIPGTDENAMIIIDVTTSLQVKFTSETSVTYIINFNGNASHDPQDSFLIFHALDVRCGIGIEKNTNGTYSFIDGSFEIIQKENSVTTEEIANGAVTTEKIANKAITLDKIADGVLSSFSSIIDKGILNEGNIRGLCESTETGIFKFIDGDNRLNCLLFKPYQPKGNYEYMCLTHAEDGDLNIAVRGGDGGGHGGWQYITETSITPDSVKPISSGAVYNAIYSVLNTEV